MRPFRRQSLPRAILSLVSAALLAAWGLPACAVSITTPRDNSRVMGVARIAATPDEGEEGFAYAVLLVDNERYSFGNVQPLRFDVDTAGLANGAHQLQIQLCDLGGLLAKSKAVSIIVANQLPDLIDNVLDPAAAVPSANPEAQPAPLAAAPPSIRCAKLTVLMKGTPLPVEPFIKKGRAMVLLRPLIEALGGELDWNAAKRQIIATVAGRRFCFTIGKNTVMVDGEKTPIGRPSAIVADRTVVPVTVWRDLFGGDVQYYGEYRCIALEPRLRQTMPEATIASIK